MTNRDLKGDRRPTHNTAYLRTTVCHVPYTTYLWYTIYHVLCSSSTGTDGVAQQVTLKAMCVCMDQLLYEPLGQ